MSKVKPPRKPRQNSGELAEGRIQPLVLGQEGLTVATGRSRLMIASGVVGERVRVRTIADRTTVERVVDASPDRCIAPCSALHRCGACCLQEMTYSAQVEAKTSALRLALTEQLGCDEKVIADVAAGRPFGYRTKLLVSAGGEPGALRFGFYRRGTLRLVPAEGCPVQHPQTVGLLAIVRQLLDAHRIAPSEQRSGKKGWLHAVGVRVDPTTSASELTLSATNARISPRLVTQLSQSVGSLNLTVNPERSSYPLAQQHNLLAGTRRTGFHIGGRRFALSAGTFMQSSAEGADLLAREVLALLPEGRMHCFADLYGGAGVFSLLSQDRWKRAVVIEENGGAIGDLRQVLRWEPKLKDRLIARPGRVEKLLAELPRRHPDCILLDPPRRGCKPAVIDALARLRPATIIYVSCGFDSLLRDGAQLQESGYVIDAVRAVDMFPHTLHLEVVARFRLA